MTSTDQTAQITEQCFEVSSTGCNSSVTVVMNPLGAAILKGSALRSQADALHDWTSPEPGSGTARKTLRISGHAQTGVLQG